MNKLAIGTLAALCATATVQSYTAVQAADPTDSYRATYSDAVSGKTVGLVFTDMNTDLSLIWSKNIQRDLEQFGVKTEIRDANWSPETQVQALEAYLSAEDKPDVLVIQNFNLTASASPIKRLKQAGMKIVQLNMRSRVDTNYYVGADWVGIGEAVATELVKDCSPANGKSGKVALVQGDVTGPDSFFQMQGMQPVFDAHPEIQVVSNLGSEWDASKARDITAVVLQQHPDLCAVYGLWDGHHVGSAEAIKEAGLQGKVLSYTNGAGHRKACDSVASGLVDKYWSYDSKRQASDVVAAVVSLLQTEDAADTRIAVYSPLTLISKETLDPALCFDLD